MTTVSSLDPGLLDQQSINTVRFLAVDAGATQGWRRDVGDWGDVIGVDRLGASAPGPIVMREYGFSVENVCQRALALLERKEV